MSSSHKSKTARPYALEFDLRAQREFRKLDPQLQLQFAKKLKERLEQPKVESDKLTGMADCYKIKLRSAGYRLVYQIVEDRLVVIVIAVGKRERNAVYAIAKSRLP
jgi:mRNA interferase RelE/StbE